MTKKIRLVKYDIACMPETIETTFHISSAYALLSNATFACFGEIKGMKGHSYCQDIKTGIPIVLHTDNLIDLTEDEL